MSSQQQETIDEQADTEDNNEEQASQEAKKVLPSLDKDENPRSWDFTETEETEFVPDPNVKKFTEPPDFIDTDKYSINVLGFNGIEHNRIIRGLAFYYLYKAFIQDGLLADLYLDFDKNIGQDMAHIRHEITDRAEFEAIKQFLQDKIRNERLENGHFLDQPPAPQKVETEKIEYEYEYVLEEEEEEDAPDDFKKDPDWKA